MAEIEISALARQCLKDRRIPSDVAALGRERKAWGKGIATGSLNQLSGGECGLALHQTEDARTKLCSLYPSAKR